MQNIIIPYQDTFDTLNSNRHTTREYQIMSIWPNDIPTTKTTVSAREFWLLNDVLGTIKNLDLEIYQSRSTIGNILREYAPDEMLPQKKFKLFDKHVYVINIDETLTAEISRYAAWTIMKEIGNHHDTTFQQEYFLAPNPNLGQIFAHTRHISRIATREEVAKYHKQLNGILGHLTKRKNDFAEFHRKLFEWLFPNTTQRNIQHHYHISESKPLADYMNDELITVFANALKNTIQQYDTLPRTKQTYSNLYQIAQKEMISARKLFANENDAPELNFCTMSVDGVIADRKKREQAFVNKYIYEKVR